MLFTLTILPLSQLALALDLVLALLAPLCKVGRPMVLRLISLLEQNPPCWRSSVSPIRRARSLSRHSSRPRSRRKSRSQTTPRTTNARTRNNRRRRSSRSRALEAARCIRTIISPSPAVLFPFLRSLASLVSALSSLCQLFSCLLASDSLPVLRSLVSMLSGELPLPKAEASSELQLLRLLLASMSAHLAMIVFQPSTLAAINSSAGKSVATDGLSLANAPAVELRSLRAKCLTHISQLSMLPLTLSKDVALPAIAPAIATSAANASTGKQGGNEVSCSVRGARSARGNRFVV